MMIYSFSAESFSPSPIDKGSFICYISIVISRSVCKYYK